MIIILIALSPIQAFAAAEPFNAKPLNYLSLGDSIAYGMSADEGMSYFKLFSEFKDESAFMKAGSNVNLAVPGATTVDLLESLATKEFQKAIKKADVITISIGGNNLLKPVIAAVFMAYGLNPEVNTIEELIYTIASFGGSEINAMSKWAEVTALIIASAQNTSSGQLGYFLVLGQQAFIAQMPLIYETIRELNPNAKIVALNQYNPFVYAENALLYGLFETLAGGMNNLLDLWALNENCFVADVHDAFFIVPDAVTFSLNPATLNLDIHPTTLGHGLIFGLLEDLDIVAAFTPPGRMAN
jgi:lysophospholipase L1-like esterase